MINKDGFDFNVEELADFDVLIEKVATMQQNELSENDMDGVTGGAGVGLFLLGNVAWWMISKALDNAWSKPNNLIPNC